MKGIGSAVMAITVTGAVYTWLAFQTAREVRHALMRRTREKYAQRPVDF